MNRRRIRLLVILIALVALSAGGFVAVKARHASLPHDQAFALGQKHLAEGRVNEAYTQLAHAARVHPSEARYHWEAAKAAARLGHAQVAEEHAKEAWSRGMKNRDVFLLRAGALKGDAKTRLDKGLAWLRELPEGPIRTELEGDLQQSVGAFSECLRTWTELFATSPSPPLANKIALARIATGAPEAAHELLKHCRAGGGLDDEGYGLLASLSAYRDDADEAGSVLAEGRARFASSSSLRLTEAVYRIWQDRLSDAAALLEPLMKRTPDEAESGVRTQARIFLGFLAAVRADVAALEALATEAQGDGPVLEGERLYYRGLKDRSVDQLKRARLLMKAHPAGDWSLARELARAGAWKESVETYRGIVGLLARAPALQIELAFSMRRAGQADEAFVLLNRLHARGFGSKASLEMVRDMATLKGLAGEAAAAQAQLEKRFRDDPSVGVAAGLMALHSGNLAEASSILESLAGKHPERDDVEAARLSVLFSGKDYEGVIKAAASSRANPETLAPIQAAALVMLGRDGDASALYEKILAKRRDPLTLLSYANLLLRLDKLDRAAEKYEEALKLQPKNPAAHLGLGTLALRRRDWKRAREHADAAAAGLAHPYPHLLIAEVELQTGKPDRALAACNKALSMDSKNESATILLGAANLELGRIDEADAILTKCAAERPDAPGIQLNLARVRMAREAFGEALSIVDSALARKLPGEVSFQTLRLVILGRMGRGNDARAQLAAIGSNLPPERAVLCEAWILQQEGRTEEAVDRLRGELRDPHVALCWAELTLKSGTATGVFETLDRHELTAERWVLVGEWARKKGLMGAAAGSYRRAMKGDPENPELLNNFAFASLQLESFDEADVLAAGKKACSILPGNPSVLHTYASALLRCKKPRECLDLLDKSPAVTHKSARLLLAHAEAAERLQQWPVAVKSLSACLVHPDTAGAAEGELSRPAIQARLEKLKARLEPK